MSTASQLHYLPSTAEIRETFANEITGIGGTVPDVYDDGERLFARAVLPNDAEVRPGDRVRAGVALRVAGPVALIHPYTFRQVCSNGAIVAHALQTRHVARVEDWGWPAPELEAEVALAELRAAVRTSAAAEAFATVADELRSAAEVEADLTIHLMPALAGMPRDTAATVLRRVVPRFEAGGDRSAFGLLNAVTSVARDTRDPETRWRLEELGGTMPARLLPKPKRTAPAAVLVGASAVSAVEPTNVDWGVR
jgi:hypothetical protein